MTLATQQYDLVPPGDAPWATTALHSMLSKDCDELKSLWTVAGQVLRGYDAVPIELKILLDRLFATYHESIRLERRHRLAYLGWSEEEYERGYKIVVSLPSGGGVGLQVARCPTLQGGYMREHRLSWEGHSLLGCILVDNMQLLTSYCSPYSELIIILTVNR